MDVGQDGMAPGVMKRNVANLYDHLTGNRRDPAFPPVVEAVTMTKKALIHP